MKKNPSGTTNKKVPMRTCCGCRQSFPKKELIRIVRTPEGEVVIDYSGKKAGRGAYICDKPECIEKCVKNKILGRVFEQEISSEVYDAIKRQYADKQN